MTSQTVRIYLNRNLLKTLMFLLVYFAACASLGAQDVDPLESLGIRPVSSRLPVQNGYIDLSDGDLHLEIPLGTFPQRPTGSVKFVLMYDSALWSQGTSLGWSSPFINGYPFDYGWRLVSSADAGSISHSTTNNAYCSTDHTYGYYTLNHYSYTGSDGTSHLFSPALTAVIGLKNKCGDYTGMTHGHGTGYAQDASGYQLSSSVSSSDVVTAPDGTIVYYSALLGSTKDTNGNYFAWDSNANLADTLGRTLVAQTVNGNTVTYAVSNAEGGTSIYTVTLETINVWTNFAAAGSGIGDYKGSGPTIQSIQLPDGTSYSFTYDTGTTQGHYGQWTEPLN